MDERIIVGKDDITDLVVQEINNNLSNAILRGRLNQKKIAKYVHDNRHAMLDGLGQMHLSIDADLYFAYRDWMKTEMKDPNYECWEDPDFCKFLYKHFPELRAPNSGKVVKSKYLAA